MAAPETPARLVFLHGPRSGDELTLDAAHYRIGSGSGCEIVLSGKTVEALHAELSLSSGDWQISSAMGRVGILVNEHKVTRTRLFHGDRIQIGNDHLMELRLPQQESGRKSRDEKQPKGKGGPWWASPWTFVGIGVYLAALAAGIGYLVSSGGDDLGEGLDVRRVRQLVCLSERYLGRLGPEMTLPPGGLAGDRATNCRWPRQDLDACTAALAAQPDPQEAPTGPPVRDPESCAAVRTDLLDLRNGVGADGEARSQRIMAFIEGHLLEAWLFEAQDRRKRSIEVYDRLIDCVPDVRLPATCFALERRRAVRGAL